MFYGEKHKLTVFENKVLRIYLFIVYLRTLSVVPQSPVACELERLWKEANVARFRV